MQSDKEEQFLKLCERAAAEQDSEKLLQLAKEILRVLDEKNGPLKRSATASAENSKQQ